MDRRQFFGAAAAVGTLGALTATGTATAAGTVRIGAWGAAPFKLDGITFGGQTARLVVHPSTGGANPRLRLTNSTGLAPVTVDRVCLGRHRGDGAVVSNTPVTFGGADSVTIAPGAAVVSDPVALTVYGGSDLAVSIYLAQPVADVTGHRLAAQRSYVTTDGDHTADLTGNAYTTTIGHWYLLDEITVEAAAPAGTIVCVGDSITDGVGSDSSANTRWPDQLANRVRAANLNLGVLNAGISGNRVLADSASQNSQARLDRDVLSHPNVSTVLMVEGINDIATGAAASAADLTGAYRQLAARLHQHGITFLLGTITPWLGSAGFSDAKEAVREGVNAEIRAGGIADAVLDFDLALRDPAEPKRMLADYDSGGGVHPNSAGYAAMAAAVDLGLLHPRKDTSCATLP